LRRELTATVVANDLVNRMGVSWAMRTAGDLGVDTATVAAAWWIARQVIDADSEWRRVEALDLRADPVLQLELKATVDWLVDAYTRSYLRQGRTGDVAAAIDQDRPAFVELREAAAAMDARAQWRSGAERWIDLGIDEEAALHIAVLPALTLVPGVAATARASGRRTIDCGRVYDLLAERLPLQQLITRLMAVEPHGRWERGQHRGLLDDIRRLHHGAARAAIADAPTDTPPEDVVERWLEPRTDAVDRAVGLTRQVQAQADTDLHALAVAVRALTEALS
jgi:glutamate dehydrogenase